MNYQTWGKTKDKIKWISLVIWIQVFTWILCRVVCSFQLHQRLWFTGYQPGIFLYEMETRTDLRVALVIQISSIETAQNRATALLLKTTKKGNDDKQMTIIQNNWQISHTKGEENWPTPATYVRNILLWHWLINLKIIPRVVGFYCSFLIRPSSWRTRCKSSCWPSLTLNSASEGNIQRHQCW